MNGRDFLLYLLPHASGRHEALEDVLNGKPNPRRYLFYGLDYFKSSGCKVRHNIKQIGTFSHHFSWLNQRFFSAVGVTSGDLSWILPAWSDLRSCAAVVAYSDRVILALCQMRIMGLVPRVPTLCIPVGLPEKLASFKNRRLLSILLAELSRFECIASLSVPECERLTMEFGLSENVRFVHAGVDTVYFSPLNLQPDVDIISIGADPFRDFETLLIAAARMPECTFRLIMRQHTASQFGAIPSNVEILLDVPMETIPRYLESGKIAVVPVRDNSYSGATTVLLQAMSMGRAVIANPCGANKSGYGFEDGVNCRLIAPQNVDTLVITIRELLNSPDMIVRLGDAARRHVSSVLNLEVFHSHLGELLTEISNIPSLL